MSDYISREQAIEEINKYRMTSGVSNQGTWNECVDVIAHTVSELPSADFRENKGDLISRAEVLKHKEILRDDNRTGHQAVKTKYIRELPSVENKGEPKTGHWISNAEDDLKISEYTCSNCKGLSDEDFDFCPNCGAKMKGGE